MSIVIKSNNMFQGVSPTVEQILTSADAVYSAFAARVVADGGVIVNESKTRDAVNFLFKNSLYGRMGVCASPHYAVKLDGSGGVLKLYSIKGQDLVGRSIGGGSLPKITADNFVNFNDGVSFDSVGGILTTPTKQAWSVTGRFGVAVATKENVNTSYSTSSATIFDMTTHGDTALNGDVMNMLTDNISNGRVLAKVNGSAYGSVGGPSVVVVSINNTKNGALMYFCDAVSNKVKLMIHGVSQGIPLDPYTPIPQVYKNLHYLDFGGADRSTTKTVSGVKMSAMWFMKDLAESQAIEINKFQEEQYL